MPDKIVIPAARAWPAVPREFYAFFQQIASSANNITTTDLTDLTHRVEALEDAQDGGTGLIISGGSLRFAGKLPGNVYASLDGDTDSPTATQYYGSDVAGTKGWFNVSDALAEGAGNVTLTVGTDGVTSFDLSSGVLASLSLADSSVQPGDNVSTLTNDAGYVDAAGASAAAPVQSVNGATGTVVLSAADVGAATTAQGAKADSAVQSIVAGTGVTVDATDPQNPVVSAPGAGAAIPAGYIDGLQMQWVSATALTVSSGAAYIEGTGAVLAASAAMAKTGLSLSASTWYHVYLYDNAGTSDVELSTTAPASPYNGTARSKTGDSSRRYVGSVRTDASGNLKQFRQAGSRVTWYTPMDGAGQRVLAAGTASAATSIDLSSALPATATHAQIRALSTGSVASRWSNQDIPGASTDSGPGTFYIMSLSAGSQAVLDFPAASNQTILYWLISAGTGIYCDVLGYLFER